MSRNYEWKLSTISDLEDVGHHAYLLVDKTTITDSMVLKREKSIVLKLKSGVYGIGIEDERQGIWIQRLNREPGEEKVLAFEKIEW